MNKILRRVSIRYFVRQNPINQICGTMLASTPTHSIFIASSESFPCPAAPSENDIDKGDTAWILMASALVLLMTPGLAFFYGGLVRKKNVINTLLMTYVAFGVLVLHWVLFGYTWSFAPGNPVWGGFDWVGMKNVGGTPNPDYAPTIPHLLFANFQMMFAVITPALISGGIVERVHFRSYVLFILLWSTLVYVPLAHWVWSGWTEEIGNGQCEYKTGWLRSLGAIDFAGGVVIHISSGVSALVASYIVGMRSGYDVNQPVQPNNIPFVMLGVGILWFGWVGFKGGCALEAGPITALAAINTSIAGGAGFLVWMCLDVFLQRRPSAVGSVTGAVIGLVGITPACGFVLPGWAILFGVIPVLICYPAIKNKKLFRVDDSLDVFFCHGIGGIVGSFMTGLFASKDVNPAGDDGAFYGNPKLLGLQVLATLVSIVLGAGMTAAILLLFKYTPIGLRTNSRYEEDGLDSVIHNEQAFEEAPFERVKRAFSTIGGRRSTSNLNNASPQDIQLQ